MEKQRLRSRLSSYWKMELGNVLILPAAMVFLCILFEQSLSWWLALACLPMCGLLVVGGLYWRAKLHQLEGRGQSLAALLPWIAALQYPFAVLSVLSFALILGVWLFGIGASTGEKISITIAAVMTILEYINYYHRQLQHFDHVADFKRLISGNGFRKSWMARDLERIK